MLDFIKYITPSWYFNKKLKNQISYFVDYTLLDPNDSENCDFNFYYSNTTAEKIDIAFQLWRKGYITSNQSTILSWHENDTCINDKYIFINRFYKKRWSFLVLFFRFLEFKNPIKELYAH